MKTMKIVKGETTTIRRVKEVDVQGLLSQGWQYTSKSEWKEQVRDVEKPRKQEVKDDPAVVKDDSRKTRKFYKQKKRLKMARKEMNNG